MTDQPSKEGVALPEEGGTQFKEVQELARQVGQTMSGKSETEVLEWLDPGDGAPAREFKPPQIGGDPSKPAPAAEAPVEPAAGPGDETPPEGDGDPGDAQGAADAATASEPAKPEDESAYETALRALRRAKTPSTVIRGMPREQVVAWGLELSKVQAGADSMITELRELRSATPTPENPPGEPTKAPDTADATGVADLKALSEALGLDAEGGAVLENALKARDDRVQKALAERDQRDKVRDQALANLLLEGARTGLRERFPSLADREKYREVEDKTRQLFRGGGYDSVSDAMEDAASIILKDDVAASSDRKALAKAKARPTPPRRSNTPQTMSTSDRQDAVLAAIESGAPREQAAAAGGW